MKALTERLQVLSEYELGRAQMAIEWVARAQKPIVEIGGQPITQCDLRALATDLSLCIANSGERVRAFIIPDRARSHCCYGFYRYPWAMKALLDAWGIEKAPSAHERSLWQQGLIFGYGSAAIQEFIVSAFSAQASRKHRRLCSPPYRLCRVEIYGSLVLHAQRRSNQNDKSRKFRYSCQS